MGSPRASMIVVTESPNATEPTPETTHGPFQLCVARAGAAVLEQPVMSTRATLSAASAAGLTPPDYPDLIPGGESRATVANSGSHTLIWFRQ